MKQYANITIIMIKHVISLCTYSLILVWKSPLFPRTVALATRCHLVQASLGSFPTSEQQLWKEKKNPTSQDQKFGREIFSEAMQSYFWDCWDESLNAESSSEDKAVEKRNVVQFSLPKRSSPYILVRISRAQFPTLTSQSTNSLFSLYMSMVIRLERLHK